MMRSWLPDLLEEYGVERSAFVTQHDVFLRAQLDRIFAKSPTSTSFADNPAPYEPLPLIGHYATYTLNMIMVRVAVAHEAFVVDDGGAPAEARGRRWDQLRNLWRSWFADEDITAASTFLDSTHDGDHVLVWARDSPLKPDAMADVGLGAERLDVALELLMRIVRAAGWPRDSERLDVLGRCAHDAVRLIATSHSHVDLLTALTAPEAPRHLRAETARVMLHPRDLTGLWSLPDAFATAYISFCARRLVARLRSAPPGKRQWRSRRVSMRPTRPGRPPTPSPASRIPRGWPA
jgi:hypothetical protein